MDRGLTGANRARPGLDQALAAVRTGDTLVVPKLDRLARSVPDARTIADTLVARSVKLALGSSVYDPADPMGKMFFQHPGYVCRVRGRPHSPAHARGHGGRPRPGQAQGQTTQAVRLAAEGAAAHARHRRLFDQ